MIVQSIKDAYYAMLLPASKVLRPIYALDYRLRRKAIRRIHVGCGANYMEGFINIDGNFRRKVDYVLDVRAGLPFADSSIDYIYSCHMLEHVYVYDAIAILKEWLRVLDDTGYVRLVLPDFEYALSIAAGRVQCAFPRKFTSPAAQAINFLFCDGQHKYGYTHSLLEEVAREAGFARVEAASPDGDRHVSRRELPTGSFCVNLYKH